MIQRKETLAEVMLYLCVELSRLLITMLGQPAFLSVYESNLHRCKSPLPSLRKGDEDNYDFSFTDLKIALEDLSEAAAMEAATSMLGSFVTLLNSLIGEMVVKNILVKAWGEDVFAALIGKEKNG
jgi:hypothetical protein